MNASIFKGKISVQTSLKFVTSSSDVISYAISTLNLWQKNQEFQSC